jgi:hypothetical protein
MSSTHSERPRISAWNKFDDCWINLAIAEIKYQINDEQNPS